jgi:hypothetical protein
MKSVKIDIKTGTTDRKSHKKTKKTQKQEKKTNTKGDMRTGKRGIKQTKNGH